MFTCCAKNREKMAYIGYQTINYLLKLSIKYEALANKIQNSFIIETRTKLFKKMIIILF